MLLTEGDPSPAEECPETRAVDKFVKKRMWMGRVGSDRSAPSTRSYGDTVMERGNDQTGCQEGSRKQRKLEWLAAKGSSLSPRNQDLGLASDCFYFGRVT
jgi:hypothetical protein